MEHCGGLELTRVIARAASSCDRYKHVEILPNVLLSHEDEISLATARTIQGEKEGTVGGALRERREECNFFTVSVEPKLSKLREGLCRWLHL